MAHVGSNPTLSAMKKIIFYIPIGLLFAIFLFFRFYHLEARATIAWDQMDNAWAAVRILRNHTYPLVGMMAKLNSGIVIGPAYYYIVAIFYALTRYDPIASPILAGCTSIVLFFVLYALAKRLHGKVTALISVFLYTFSYLYIKADRIQWPVNFIPILSLIIFYSLYMVCRGKPKYVLLLSAAIGFSFHIHFTSVFYIPIVLAAIPFMPKTKTTLRYALYGFGIIAVFFMPQALYEIQRSHAVIAGSAVKYLSLYNHGFHLRRFFQISSDAFIEFERTLYFRWLRPFVFIVPILYTYLVFRFEKNRNWFLLPYLLCLWIIVPWVGFSMYSGELSAYYFSLVQPLAIIVVSYLLALLWTRNTLPLRIVLCVALIYYAWVNAQLFISDNGQSTLTRARIHARAAISSRIPIPFIDGDVSSYLYYMYTTLRK